MAAGRALFKKTVAIATQTKDPFTLSVAEKTARFQQHPSTNPGPQRKLSNLIQGTRPPSSSTDSAPQKPQQSYRQPTSEAAQLNLVADLSSPHPPRPLSTGPSDSPLEELASSTSETKKTPPQKPPRPDRPLSTSSISSSAPPPSNDSDGEREEATSYLADILSPLLKRIPLQKAVQDRALTSVATFLSEGQDPNKADKDGNRALHLAVQLGESESIQDSHLKLVELLLLHDANPLLENDAKQKPIDIINSYLQQNPDNATLLTLLNKLIEAEGNYRKRKKTDTEIFHNAARHGPKAQVEKLWPSMTPEAKLQGLYNAIMGAQSEIITLFFEKGVEASPLLLAIALTQTHPDSKKNIIFLLLAQGIKPDDPIPSFSNQSARQLAEEMELSFFEEWDKTKNRMTTGSEGPSFRSDMSVTTMANSSSSGSDIDNKDSTDRPPSVTLASSQQSAEKLPVPYFINENDPPQEPSKDEESSPKLRKGPDGNAIPTLEPISTPEKASQPKPRRKTLFGADKKAQNTDIDTDEQKKPRRKTLVDTLRQALLGDKNQNEQRVAPD
jgi:hypothetical protein